MRGARGGIRTPTPPKGQRILSPTGLVSPSVLLGPSVCWTRGFRHPRGCSGTACVPLCPTARLQIRLHRSRSRVAQPGSARACVVEIGVRYEAYERWLDQGYPFPVSDVGTAHLAEAPQRLISTACPTLRCEVISGSDTTPASFITVRNSPDWRKDRNSGRCSEGIRPYPE